ncbi:hypothetical protein T492DRAFT_1140706 [Pavlovales sp. CCMP2436]|nr:hypothetical protein T492DRAFT_1140706 [Pavlovales sp. CCMP2436]
MPAAAPAARPPPRPPLRPPLTAMMLRLEKERAHAGGGKEYLVKWAQWDDSHNSWVKESNIEPQLVADFERESARRNLAAIVAGGSSGAAAPPAAIPGLSSADFDALSNDTPPRVRGQWGRLAALSHFCDTRMAQSERKVYKNCLRNLHLHILDMLKVGRDAHEVDKARSLIFVVHVMGTIDVLRHVKDASIYEQTVNTLLWENELAAGGFVALLLQLADDLRSGDVSRKLPPAQGSLLGKPALKFLSSNIARLKRSTLQLIWEHTEVTLALPSGMRLTRAERICFHEVEAETAAAEAERAINFALSGLADMAALIAQNYKARRAVQNGPRTRHHGDGGVPRPFAAAQRGRWRVPARGRRAPPRPLEMGAEVYLHRARPRLRCAR